MPTAARVHRRPARKNWFFSSPGAKWQLYVAKNGGVYNGTLTMWVRGGYHPISTFSATSLRSALNICGGVYPFRIRKDCSSYDQCGDSGLCC